MAYMLWIGLVLSGLAPLHEFHVSKLQIDVVPEQQEIKITLHLFLDDLGDALMAKGSDNLFLCTEKETPDAETQLLAYINEQFQIESNGQAVPFQMLGKEISDDLAAVWCYLLVENAPSMEEITVRNELLMDLYDDQKNLVSVRLDGKSLDYYMMQKGDAIRTIKLK